MLVSKRFFGLLAIVVFVFTQARAQSPGLKFGEISPADFDLSKKIFDTTEGAVFLTDAGYIDFESLNNGMLNILFKRHLRIKILNKSGFDAADFAIPLLASAGGVETLADLNAATYSISNEKITTTPLEKTSIFTENVGEARTITKFTMPDVKAGSIIEVTYTIRSFLFQYMHPWEFQGIYPRLQSEFTVAVPEFLRYTFITQGSQKFAKEEESNMRKQFITFFGRVLMPVKVNVSIHKWVMQDVPPLKDEPYVTTLHNFISRIQFLLAATQSPYPAQDYRTDWDQMNREMVEWESFGVLDKDNRWMKKYIDDLLQGGESSLQKAQRIFACIRDNFTCTDKDGIVLSGTLKDILKRKKGSVADINLLLIAMLRHEGITAEPVLLSTRDNGYIPEDYPLVERLNYLVAAVRIDGKDYYLDASERKIGFNYLPINCYNGYARRISRERPGAVYFVADSLKETNLTSAFISTSGEKQSGIVTVNPGYYLSMDMRSQIAESGKTAFMQGLKEELPQDATADNLEIDSLNNYDAPIALRYNITLPKFSDDIVYFSPMLGDGWKDNMFKSAERVYPVEMPSTMDEVYTLNMEIPEGYVIDELPKPERANLNENDGFFEFMASTAGNRIMLRSRIKINRAYFLPTEYQSLRGFFDQVVKKHAEVIVFRKKK